MILSELSLSTRGSQHEFEPQKLHLPFQSFFFIHIGEYRSALRIFIELKRSIGYYEETVLFIDKSASLSKRSYPDHFLNLAQRLP